MRNAQKKRSTVPFLYNQPRVRHADRLSNMLWTACLAYTPHIRLGIPEWIIASRREVKLPQMDHMF